MRLTAAVFVWPVTIPFSITLHIQTCTFDCWLPPRDGGRGGGGRGERRALPYSAGTLINTRTHTHTYPAAHTYGRIGMYAIKQCVGIFVYVKSKIDNYDIFIVVNLVQTSCYL